ncbi:MAG TPA: tRNA adenosine(34) deaminase TadA [Syntrophales bacterium]|nr:tRNA adenosine(34) deaminase TadA [Syntrophales bacterium]HOM08055.1 tRNA adenosine(34) deaminase TadA [Syntrophales bacterium]HON99821.1 tRNA adenosine(34) deaminase TadA [Syntrophales bacterium]HPC01462.1 tRNA adenosine(34) deaminase TadA [Syntrophales bacterium]HPQ07474.1 tRNA adenosine(34) deaminase TadA [Syntrophales bacterium]
MVSDEAMMTLALREAARGLERGEVPVGAVLVKDGRILARAHNACLTMNDPTAHAEVLALREGGRILGNYRLMDTTLYVTLEPCIMCTGALVHARVSRLVYGAADPKGGAVASLHRLLADERLNHRVLVTAGILEGPCGEILSGFFRKKRLSSPLRSDPEDERSGEIPKWS